MNCNGCGAKLPPAFTQGSGKAKENTTCQELYDKLSLYTLNHTDPIYFIHQLIVDAYAASHAKAGDLPAGQAGKPIRFAFALIGLYLFAEKGYTGKQVQNAHMWLASRNKPSTTFTKQSVSAFAKSNFETIPKKGNGYNVKVVLGKSWPTFKKPSQKARVNVGDVLNVLQGRSRDEMIKKWAKSVWQANIDNRPEIINLLAEMGFTGV